MIATAAEVNRGQVELAEVLDAGPIDGYDAHGHLMAAPADGDQVCGPEDGGQARWPEGAARLDALAGEINAISNHAKVVLCSAAIDIGRRLIEARALVPRGRWGEWLRANVEYSERKAQVLMQLYEEYGTRELPGGYMGLGISHITALLAAPEDQRDDMARRASEEGLSVRELKAEIEKLRAEAEEKQLEIEGLSGLREERDRREDEVERLNEVIADYERRMAMAEEKRRDNEIAAEKAIQREREAAQLSEAKARSAESSAEALRKLRADAEERAEMSAQRASDAVHRANQTAKDLAQARARIAELEARGPETVTETVEVEVVPEAVLRELDALRKIAAEHEAREDGGAAGTVAAAARFQDCYKRLTDEFRAAEALVAEIAREDAHTGHMYATAIVSTCRKMIDRLGEASA